MADVFLSYARPAAAVARNVARELETSGRTVWYDSALPAHRTYSDLIASELEEARSVLVLWSKDAVSSQWVRSEADRARLLNKLVQARLDDSTLPMPFDQIQCADLRHWRRSHEHVGWSQILTSVDELAGGSHNLRASAGGTYRPARRAFLLGAPAVAGAIAMGAGWWLWHERSSKPRVPPDIAAVMDQAKVAMWQNTPEGQNQSIGLYRKVVSEHSDIAEAWGGLAMAYSTAAHWRQSTESHMFYDRARSAASRALALDTRNISGLIGLARARPIFGNWLNVEHDLRAALVISPKDAEISVVLADLLSKVGRNRDALSYVNVSLPGGPTPGFYIMRAGLLWSAERQEELDTLLDEAAKLYPTHFGVWFTRYYTAMMSGRPDAALALAGDLSARPTSIAPEEIDAVNRVAKAIKSRSQPEVTAVTKEWLARAHEGTGYAENAAQFLATLGQIDEAFAVLRAYFFSEGFDCGESRFKDSIGSFTPHDDRQTAFLFNPAIKPLRNDGRFAKLMSELRMTDYWRVSRTVPDYQRDGPR